MKSLLTLAAVTLLIFTQTACSESMLNATRPAAFVFNHMPEGTPHNYQRGWKDGCETGMTAQSNDFYKTFYQVSVDPNMMQNEYYFKAYNSAFNYCRGYAYGILKEGHMMAIEANHGTDAWDSYGVLDWLGNWGAPIVSHW